MFQRASRSVGWFTARSMCFSARTSPSWAIASAGGLTAFDRNVSTQWATASMPVAAVSFGGSP